MNVLITGERRIRGPFPLNQNYESIIKRVLGNETQISRMENLPECARRMYNGEVDGVIVPFGHGDKNTLINLKLNLAYLTGLVIPSSEVIAKVEVPVPIFEDHHFISGIGKSCYYIRDMQKKYAYEGKNALEGWLEEVGRLAKK